MSVADEAHVAAEEKRVLQRALNGRRLYGANWTWAEVVAQTKADAKVKESLSSWLESMLPLSPSKSFD